VDFTETVHRICAPYGRLSRNVLSICGRDELSEEDSDFTAPPPEEIKRIGGRSVRIKHREASPEERRKVEAEQIEVIASLVKKERSQD